MDSTENASLVRQAGELMSKRDFDAFFDLIHEDATWEVPYRSDRFAFGGSKSKEGLRELLNSFLGSFAEFSFDASSFTAQADRVAVEAKSRGVDPAGQVYENNYLLMFRIKDGKIFRVQEYFDPFNVLDYVERIS